MHDPIIWAYLYFGRYGVECSYAHNEIELRHRPNLRKTRLCKNFEMGGYAAHARWGGEVVVARVICPYAVRGLISMGQERGPAQEQRDDRRDPSLS